MRNSGVLLNCTATCCPGASTSAAGTANITWLKDGVIVNDASRTVLSNGSLYIKRVIARKQPRRSDEGTYECVARNDIGAIISRRARLRVAGKCMVLFALSDL